jgi:hypothetical protein
MKFRIQHSAVTDDEECHATEELRQAVQRAGIPADQAPSESYWSNLLVRSNERIDHVTSGKAISLSWAARVALPGVIAIIFFFVALHYYYEPGQSGGTASLAAVVASLPEDVVDSLTVESTSSGLTLASTDLERAFMAPSDEQLVNYLITSGSVATALEAMDDEQVQEVLTTLGSQSVQL